MRDGLAVLASAAAELIRSASLEVVWADPGPDGGTGAKRTRIIINVNWPVEGGMGRKAPSH